MAMSVFHKGKPLTILGAKKLNGCVRHGNRWYLLAVITKLFMCCVHHSNYYIIHSYYLNVNYFFKIFQSFLSHYDYSTIKVNSTPLTEISFFQLKLIITHCLSNVFLKTEHVLNRRYIFYNEQILSCRSLVGNLLLDRMVLLARW